MIGIDTNLLLRLIVGDEPKQAVPRASPSHLCSADEPAMSARSPGRAGLDAGESLRLPTERMRRHRADPRDRTIEVESSNDVAGPVKQYRNERRICRLSLSSELSKRCTHNVTSTARREVGGYELRRLIPTSVSAGTHSQIRNPRSFSANCTTAPRWQRPPRLQTTSPGSPLMIEDAPE